MSRVDRIEGKGMFESDRYKNYRNPAYRNIAGTRRNGHVIDNFQFNANNVVHYDESDIHGDLLYNRNLDWVGNSTILGVYDYIGKKAPYMVLDIKSASKELLNSYFDSRYRAMNSVWCHSPGIIADCENNKVIKIKALIGFVPIENINDELLGEYIFNYLSDIRNVCTHFRLNVNFKLYLKKTDGKKYTEVGVTEFISEVPLKYNGKYSEAEVRYKVNENEKLLMHIGSIES